MGATKKRPDNREIERILGQQYAQVLRESRDHQAYRDCREVVQESLNLLEHYNKVSMALRAGANKFKGALT